MRLAPLAATLLLAAAPLGCSSLGPIGDALAPFTPKVRFEKLALQGLDFTKIDVDFVFAIDNPNPLNVKLDTFSYALGLEGVEFLRGVNEQGLALKARGTSELALPVSLRFADIFKLVGAVSGKDELAFAISGDFGFQTPLGLARVPFKDSGKLPVVRPPEIGLAGLRLGKLDLLAQKATLELDLTLANPHGGSALQFSGFDYKVALGATPVAAGLVDDIPAVGAGARQTVTLPLSLNLRSLGTAIAGAITGKGSLDVGLGATVKVGTPFGAVPLSIDQSGRLSVR